MNCFMMLLQHHVFNKLTVVPILDLSGTLSPPPHTVAASIMRQGSIQRRSNAVNATSTFCSHTGKVGTLLYSDFYIFGPR